MNGSARGAKASFTLSAFGDEVAADLLKQLQLLSEIQITRLDFRSAWGINVLQLSDDQVRLTRQLCDRAGFEISCIGSPVGKSPITSPLEKEIENLARTFQVGQLLGCRRVRVFSFYPPDTSGYVNSDTYLPQATQRLAQLTSLAEQEGFELLLENEKQIVGDTPERCRALLEGVNSSHLRCLWDPANFVQVGVARPMDTGWPLLSDYVTYVHIKDARLVDGVVCAAGEGDGQLFQLLQALDKLGYQGVLALEPHLVTAGHSGGFSGTSGMRYAAERLRRLLARLPDHP